MAFPGLTAARHLVRRAPGVLMVTKTAQNRTAVSEPQSLSSPIRSPCRHPDRANSTRRSERRVHTSAKPEAIPAQRERRWKSDYRSGITGRGSRGFPRCVTSQGGTFAGPELLLHPTLRPRLLPNPPRRCRHAVEFSMYWWVNPR